MISNKLNIIVCRFRNLSLRVEDELATENLNEQTRKNMINAFNQGIIDKQGELWLSKNGLSHILRKKGEENVNAELQGINKKHKLNCSGETFIKLEVILERLEIKHSMKPTDIKLLALIKLLNKTKIDFVVLYQKVLVAEEVEKQLQLLGKLRMKKYSIKNDELTNLPLKNPEFHHIRSRELTGNLKYQLDIEMGIIINKDIHEKITLGKCKNEIILKKICEENNWNISWYDGFKKAKQAYK